MAKPSSETNGGATCVHTKCDETNTTCVHTCVRSSSFLSSPPPQHHHAPTNAVNSNNNAVAPFLIATVCILGISFLLLTTCTIILRYRFSRRQTLPRDPDQQPSPHHHHPGGGGDHTVFNHHIWHVTTVGLQQSVIDSITAFKYQKLDGFLIDGDDCSVCLTEFIDGDDLRLLPKCCHAFHVVCIDTWLRSHRNCPLCRAPIVSDDPGVGTGGEGDLHGGQNGEMDNIEGGNNEEYVSDHGSHQLRESGENEGWELCRGPEITYSCSMKIAQILKRNRELRICSDLGVNYRFRGMDEDGGDDVEPIKRSYSFNCSTTNGTYRNIGDLSTVGNDEGCSSNAGSSETKEEKIEAEKVHRWSSSVYGLWKSSSFGRSLQKGPVSMKRSFSSGGKFFAFRRTKNNSSILPL